MPDAVVTPPAPVVTAPAGAPAPAAPAPAAAPPAEASPWAAGDTPPKPSETAPAADDKSKKEEIKYDLKLPKDSHMDPAAVDKFTSFAKERGLTNEQAQAVLEMNHAERAGVYDSAKTQMKEQNASWLKQLRDDKEFGGDKFAVNAENAKKAFDRFDKDGSFRKALKAGEMDNHPLLVKFVSAVGKAFAEDSLAAPTLNAPGKDTREPVTKLKEHYAGQKR